MKTINLTDERLKRQIAKFEKWRDSEDFSDLEAQEIAEDLFPEVLNEES